MVFFEHGGSVSRGVRGLNFIVRATAGAWRMGKKKKKLAWIEVEFASGIGPYLRRYDGADSYADACSRASIDVLGARPGPRVLLHQVCNCSGGCGVLGGAWGTRRRADPFEGKGSYIQRGAPRGGKKPLFLGWPRRDFTGPISHVGGIGDVADQDSTRRFGGGRGAQVRRPSVRRKRTLRLEAQGSPLRAAPGLE